MPLAEQALRELGEPSVEDVPDMDAEPEEESEEKSEEG